MFKVLLVFKNKTITSFLYKIKMKKLVILRKEFNTFLT